MKTPHKVRGERNSLARGTQFLVASSVVDACSCLMWMPPRNSCLGFGSLMALPPSPMPLLAMAPVVPTPRGKVRHVLSYMADVDDHRADAKKLQEQMNLHNLQDIEPMPHGARGHQARPRQNNNTRQGICVKKNNAARAETPKPHLQPFSEDRLRELIPSPEAMCSEMTDVIRPLHYAACDSICNRRYAGTLCSRHATAGIRPPAQLPALSPRDRFTASMAASPSQLPQTPQRPHAPQSTVSLLPSSVALADACDRGHVTVIPMLPRVPDAQPEPQTRPQDDSAACSADGRRDDSVRQRRRVSFVSLSA